MIAMFIQKQTHARSNEGSKLSLNNKVVVLIYIWCSICRDFVGAYLLIIWGFNMYDEGTVFWKFISTFAMWIYNYLDFIPEN